MTTEHTRTPPTRSEVSIGLAAVGLLLAIFLGSPGIDKLLLSCSVLLFSAWTLFMRPETPKFDQLNEDFRTPYTRFKVGLSHVCILWLVFASLLGMIRMPDPNSYLWVVREAASRAAMSEDEFDVGVIDRRLIVDERKTYLVGWRSTGQGWLLNDVRASDAIATLLLSYLRWQIIALGMALALAMGFMKIALWFALFIRSELRRNDG